MQHIYDALSGQINFADGGFVPIRFKKPTTEAVTSWAVSRGLIHRDDMVLVDSVCLMY